MSTRSRIALALPGGKYRSVYCHGDGYPSWVGRVLLGHYRDAEKVARLLSLGSLSGLGEEIGEKHPFNQREQEPSVCTFYGRDRGEEGVEAEESDDFAGLAEAAQDGDAEYLYLFHDDVWLFAKVKWGELPRFEDLALLTPRDVVED